MVEVPSEAHATAELAHVRAAKDAGIHPVNPRGMLHGAWVLACGTPYTTGPRPGHVAAAYLAVRAAAVLLSKWPGQEQATVNLLHLSDRLQLDLPDDET